MYMRKKNSPVKCHNVASTKPCTMLSCEDRALWRTAFNILVSKWEIISVSLFVSDQTYSSQKIHHVDLRLSPWHRPLLCCFSFFMHIQPFPTVALPWTLTAHSLFSHPWVYTYSINILCFVCFLIYIYAHSYLLFLWHSIYLSTTCYYIQHVNVCTVILYAVCVCSTCIFKHICKCVSSHLPVFVIHVRMCCACVPAITSFLLCFFPLYPSLLSFPLHQSLINLTHVQSLDVCSGWDQVNLWNKDNIS